MQLNNIQPVRGRHKLKRVGRGGKRGTFSGRGTKGQKARAGRRIRPAIRDILKKIPKLRGYRQKRIPSREIAVNFRDIERAFEPGETVSPASLVEKRLVRRIAGRTPRVKILGGGTLSKPLHFKDVLFSKPAREAIEKAGGRGTANSSEPRGKSGRISA